jgi:hypothetical protein
MPWHARCLENREGVPDEVEDIVEVCNAGVVVVLAREESPREVEGVHVGKWVVVRVPAAEAEVETADARVVVVDEDDLLVVRPVLDVIYGKHISHRDSTRCKGLLTFRANVVRVSKAANVLVKIFEGMLSYTSQRKG